MACPPATARALKGLSRPSGRRCDRRSRGATTARDTDDASLHGEGQVREDSTPAGETATQKLLLQRVEGASLTPKASKHGPTRS